MRIGAAVCIRVSLKQIGLAVHLFAQSNGRLPEGCGYPYARTPRELTGHVGVSWQTRILPFVEEEALWRAAEEANRIDPIGSHAAHGRVRSNVVRVLLCPLELAETGTRNYVVWWGVTSYRGVAGTGNRRNDGVFHKNFSIALTDVTDGMSQTIMVGERPAGPGGIRGAWYGLWGTSTCPIAQILPAGRNDGFDSEAIGCSYVEEWYRGGDPGSACDLNHYWSMHPGGSFFAFVDGSVRFQAYGNSKILHDLATRAGGEIVQAE